MTEDVLYVVAATYTRARNVAQIDLGRTGDGLHRQGPRPWLYAGESRTLRGLTLRADQIHWVPGWSEGRHWGEVEEFQFAAKFATRIAP